MEDENYDNLPQVKQSGYAGNVPATDYNSYGGAAADTYVGTQNNQNVSGFGSTTNVNRSTGVAPVLTGAAPSNSASGADVLVTNTNGDWVNKKWRPMMGWTYMATCTFDFIIAPILWSAIQAMANGGQVTSQWQPLTLQGAGLYHIAMGAVLGVAAFGRTKEKIEQKA